MNTEITDIIDKRRILLADAASRTHRRDGYRLALRRPTLGWVKWVPAVGLPALVIALGPSLVGWVWMWTLVLALFLGAKWITIWPFMISKPSVSRRRLLAYLSFWPGLDPKTFCAVGPVPKPQTREWLSAVAKALLGAVLVWIGVRFTSSAYPTIRGWLGMIGIVFMLHFGLFQLLSLFWRALGLNAKPIMRSPGVATSLSQFWGRSWNTAFNDLMNAHFFAPLARRYGSRFALMLVFLVSGIIHELVISLPARGGYGLPTLYFALQGLGLVIEHSKPGRKLGIRSGLKGWCLVVLIAGLPAYWLFHPAFVHKIVLPMLNAIGATCGTGS